MPDDREYCTLYVDSSGDQGWPRPFGKSNVTWYTVGGVILTPEQDLMIRDMSADILSEFISDGARTSFPPSRYELHYLDLMCGNNIYRELQREDRRRMADRVFSMIREVRPALIATSVNKLQLKKAYEHQAANPKILAAGSVIGRFSAYLARNDRIGMVVYDEEEYRSDARMRDMISDLRRPGTGAAKAQRSPQQANRLTNFLNTINLCPSELSPGIQVADFVARSVWQHREKGKSVRYGEIESLWDAGEAGDGQCRDSVMPPESEWR